MYTGVKFIITISILAALASCQSVPQRQVSKGYKLSSYSAMESDGFTTFTIGSLKPHNYTVVTDPQRLEVSKRVEKFLLNNRDCGGADCFGTGSRLGVLRERIEQRIMPKGDGYGLGNTVWYGMDLFIPEQSRDALNKSLSQTNIATVKQFTLNLDGTAKEKEPTFNLVFKGGKVQAAVYPTKNVAEVRQLTVADLDQFLGRWVRLEWAIKFSTGDDGVFRFYLNRELKFEYSGRTAAHNDKKSSFIQYGLYSILREHTLDYYWANPSEGLGSRTIYVANASIAKSRESLFPKQTLSTAQEIELFGAITDLSSSPDSSNLKRYVPLEMGSIKGEDYKDNIGKFDPSKFSDDYKKD